MNTLPHLKTNALLTSLLEKKAEDAIILKGYIGETEKKDYILLYEDIFDLSKSLEIKVSDILFTAEAPKTILPFDGVIIWLEKGSEIIPRTIEKEDKFPKGAIHVVNKETVVVTSGRLAMVVSLKPAPVGPHQPCGRPIQPVFGITISE